MFCPSCGKENANTFGHCQSCGMPLAPIQGTPIGMGQAAAPAPMPVTTQPAWMQPERRPIFIAVIVIAVVVVIGGLLVSRIDHETPQARIGRLIREASGAQPIRNASSSSDRKFDDTFRDQFRNVIRVNREFTDKIHQLKRAEIAKVGSPQSFADPSYAAEGLKELHASHDLDQQMEQKALEISGNLRRAIEDTDWSASTKQAALDGFEHGFAQALEKREHLLKVEQTYVDATDDLYAYAGAHQADMQLNNGHLRIKNNQVLQEFNSKMRQYNSRRNDLLQAKREFDQFRSGWMKGAGITKTDIGLQ